MADNLKMAVVGTQFSDATVSIAWGTGRVASEVVAVPPANRSVALQQAILRGVVVETTDPVTSIPAAATPNYIRLSGPPASGDAPLFNVATGLWDPGSPTGGGSFQPLDTDLTAIGALTSAANKVPYATGAGTWALADLSAAARTVIDDASVAAMRATLGVGTRSVNYVIDGAGVTITTGIKGDVEVPFSWTDISSVRLFADQLGSIVVNVWKDSYANFPPVVGDKITASAPPTITTATKSQDTTLTGWTKTGTSGDVLRFNVDSATTITRVTISLVFVV